MELIARGLLREEILCPLVHGGMRGGPGSSPMALGTVPLNSQRLRNLQQRRGVSTTSLCSGQEPALLPLATELRVSLARNSLPGCETQGELPSSVSIPRRQSTPKVLMGLK